MAETTAQPSGGREVGQVLNAPAPTAPPAKRGLEGVNDLLREAFDVKKSGGEGEAKPPAPSADDAELLLADPDADNAKPKTPENGGEGAAAAPGEPGAAAAAAKVTGLLELAETAGLTAEKLYGLEVSLGDGLEPVKLGALKDQHQEVARVEQSRTDLDAERSDFQNEMIRTRQEISELVQLIGIQNLPPAFVAKAQQAHVENIDKQRTELLAVKPEWKDDQVYQAAQAEILEAVEEYGFGRGDLDTVQDHRLTKLLHDFAVLKKRVTRANAKAKEIRGQASKRGSSKAPPSEGRQLADKLTRARESSDSSTKVSAISELLRGNR